jgi:hypothetical protein
LQKRVLNDITTEAAVRTCLERAARPMSPHEICAWTLGNFALPMQHNTLLKDLHFLRKKGVDIRKQEQGGHFRYFIALGTGNGGVADGIGVAITSYLTDVSQRRTPVDTPGFDARKEPGTSAPRHVYRQTFDEVCPMCGKGYWIDKGKCTVCRKEREITE